jgi:hypothetical protein
VKPRSARLCRRTPTCQKARGHDGECNYPVSEARSETMKTGDPTLEALLDAEIQKNKDLSHFLVHLNTLRQKNQKSDTPTLYKCCYCDHPFKRVGYDEVFAHVREVHTEHYAQIMHVGGRYMIETCCIQEVQDVCLTRKLVGEFLASGVPKRSTE